LQILSLQTVSIRNVAFLDILKKIAIERKPSIFEDELNHIGVSFNRRGIIVNEKMHWGQTVL